MKTIQFLLGLSLVMVAPAAAQDSEAAYMRPPMAVGTQARQEMMQNDDLALSDSERARRTIDKLKRENRELKAKLKEARASLDQRPCPTAAS